MNKLEQLKQFTTVVADTGDIEAIRKFRPLDATTNPSLLLKASQLPQYRHLLQQACAYAVTSRAPYDTATIAADKLATLIGREVLAIVEGRVSTEVDARLSFDTRATIEKARHLIRLYEELGIAKTRILIKIASTWEGICAARVLEKEGIQCNLTLLFSLEQAQACADAGAHLISPFVGRILDWYKTHTGKTSYSPEEDPGVLSVRAIYDYYKASHYPTVVMGASFRNAGQIEALAGCDRLTISPALLDELSNDTGKLTRKLGTAHPEGATDPIRLSEPDFRWALNNNAMATDKLAEGIRLFTADQVTLENSLAALYQATPSSG